jgi:hypothetical protein
MNIDTCYPKTYHTKFRIQIIQIELHIKKYTKTQVKHKKIGKD